MRRLQKQAYKFSEEFASAIPPVGVARIRLPITERQAFPHIEGQAPQEIAATLFQASSDLKITFVKLKIFQLDRLVHPD